MIISRTPLRISFVGGGSDIAAYYKHASGAVVTTAIDKYVYIMVEKQFDGRIIVQYSKTEVVNAVSNIQNNLIREAMKMTGVNKGIHLTSISDVPSEGTGMGSSSAYVVGLLNALYAYQGKHVSPMQLAREACEIEIDILHKPIGKQDQYIAAYGGFRYFQFLTDGSVSVDPIFCSPATKRKLEQRLLLFYTGVTRSADPILAQQMKRMKTNMDTQSAMGAMVAMAGVMRKDLDNNTIKSFGSLLHDNWELKKTMTDAVTTSAINTWYAKARKKGATGGKILGAGGGGFLLLYAEKRYHDKIKRALSDLTLLPFRFEPWGSKIIFVGDSV